jgi:predicted aspartyl protease
MPSLRPFSRIFPLLVCISSLPAIAAPVTETTVTFSIANNYLIVVPVTINGAGPYDFVLDTGSNNTMLDEKLADELALPRGDKRIIVGVMGSVTLSAVYANSFSIADATVAGKNLFLFTSTNLQNLPPKTRGILGEDFLQNFDVLIDYRHHIIQLESGAGILAETLTGEHLPVQLSGMLQERSTFRRLIVTGHIQELGDNSPLSLLLDSGVSNFILFRKHLVLGTSRQMLEVVPLSSSGLDTMQTRTIRRLDLGKDEVNDLTVIARTGQPESDADGLIPTSLFHSIFISHQGRFVILNPSHPKKKP